MTLFDQFDSLFDLTRDRLLTGAGSVRAFVPAADLVVTDDEVTVYMDVPGLRPENLDIQLVDDVLTVKGERTYPFATEQQNDNGNGRYWYRFERGYGKFQRMLQVPKGLNPERITASIVDGVLTLHIPQPEARKPRKIEITAGAQSVIEGSATDSSEQKELAGAAA